jgi:hypothetical protein
VQRIKAKYGVPCNNKPLLWFFAKEAPTSNGVICYFLVRWDKAELDGLMGTRTVLL